MLRKIYDFFFGCRHRFSRPITVQKRSYVVCLICGGEFKYDLETMRVGERSHGR